MLLKKGVFLCFIFVFFGFIFLWEFFIDTWHTIAEWRQRTGLCYRCDNIPPFNMNPPPICGIIGKRFTSIFYHAHSHPHSRNAPIIVRWGFSHLCSGHMRIYLVPHTVCCPKHIFIFWQCSLAALGWRHSDLVWFVLALLLLNTSL